MNLPEIPGAPVEVLVFALVALLSIVSAIAVVAARDPFTSALSLLGNFVSLGVLFLLLSQPFVAVAQILVYAGAVVVLFLFVIAYLGHRRELPGSARRGLHLPPLALLAAVALGAALVGIGIAADTGDEAQVGATFGSAAEIGEAFLTTYLLEFEVTSLLLLVAAVGGIVLGLTGRARHERLRKLMNTRSADQQRRWYEQRERLGAAAGAPPAGPAAWPTPDEHTTTHGKEPVQ